MSNDEIPTEGESKVVDIKTFDKNKITKKHNHKVPETLDQLQFVEFITEEEINEYIEEMNMENESLMEALLEERAKNKTLEKMINKLIKALGGKTNDLSNKE